MCVRSLASGDDFDGHRSEQLEITSSIDDPHAASPNQAPIIVGRLQGILDPGSFRFGWWFGGFGEFPQALKTTPARCRLGTTNEARIWDGAVHAI